MTLLKELDLSNNDLRRLTKGIFKPNLKNLEKLDISSNKISKFFVDELTEMPALKVLNMSANKLANINQELMAKIKQNLKLYFNGKLRSIFKIYEIYLI